MHNFIFLLVTLLLSFGLSGNILYAQEVPGQEEPLVLEIQDSSSDEIDLLEIDENLVQVDSPEEPSLEVDEEEIPEQSGTPANSSVQEKGGIGSFQVVHTPAVVLIKYRNTSFCSGAMVGPYTVLTARHCVHETSGGRIILDRMLQASKMTVFAGGEGTKISSSVSRIISPGVPWWARLAQGLKFIDFAILVLDKPLGKQTKWFGVAKVAVRTGTLIEVLSFPGNKFKQHPWRSVGMVTEFVEALTQGPIYTLITAVAITPFTHSARVEPGSSGGPVFLKNNYRNIIGVVSLGNNLLPTGQYAARGAFVDFVNKYRYAKPKANPTTAHRSNTQRSRRNSRQGNSRRGRRKAIEPTSTTVSVTPQDVTTQIRNTLK